MLEVINIDSSNGVLHKDRMILDSNFNHCDNILITKTKNSEVVAMAKIDGRFHLFKNPP